VFEANIVKNEVEVIIDTEVSKFPMWSLKLLMFTLSLGSRLGLGTFQHLTFWQKTFQHRHFIFVDLLKSKPFDPADVMAVQSCSVSKETFDLTVTRGTLWSNKV
jgi:hypothetical protein